MSKLYICFLWFTFSFLVAPAIAEVPCKEKTTIASMGDQRPNVLFIIVDDQSPFDLKTYDPKSPLHTPTIDRLASEGMVFEGAYHMGSFSGAVCTPSRHMVMTGRSVWHLPNVLKGKHCPTDIKRNVMAAIFNRAGYKTMRTCKKGNSYRAANEQFTVVNDATKRGGTAETGSAWHGEQVLNYLNQRESKQDKDPFLIYFGFSHPHDKRDGKPELLAKYGAVNHTDKENLPPANPKQPPLPINYLPEHPFHHGHPNLRDEVAVSGVWKNRDQQTIGNEIGRQYACNEYIDQQIARVMQRLDDMGELDNTFIVYTSDHGMAIGRHGLQGKQNLYQHTWRVPLIVKGPSIQPGKRVTGNAYLLDLLPTLCDLAEIDIPKSVEGLSLKPVLDGKTATVRDTLYGVYCGGTKPGMRSVKKGDWKLIKYDVMAGAVRQTQLFNLKTNPDELLKQHHDPQVVDLTTNLPESDQINLAGDPNYADKLAEMEALLLSEMRRLDDPYRLWDQPDDGLPQQPTKLQKQPKKKKPNKKTTKAKPNIVLMLCDDLGYGDVQSFNPSHGKISTPNIDRLASQGMMFTDAHSASSVCTPTRYGILTGRYCWRTELQKGVVQGFAPCLIDENRPTVASFLKSQGYHTGIVGKWHLNNRYLNPKTGEEYTNGKKLKFTAPIGAKIPDGPIHRGFDYFFGIHHARSMKAIVEQDTVIEHDDTINFLPRLANRCVDYIETRSQESQPFFLYVPFGSPHTPIVPTKKWEGKSGLGKYSDFVMQTDDVVGQILDAIEKHDLDRVTFVLFTSDNGCSQVVGIKKLAEKGHKVSGDLRGSKADIWEGGHRVPFIAKWPGNIAAGSKSDELICLNDFFATVTDVLNTKTPNGSCEDSVSFLPALRGEPIQSLRKGIVHHSVRGHFAYRTANWKLILARGSGGWTSPKENQVSNEAAAAQLYDLETDLGEHSNRYLDEPEIAEELLAQLTKDVRSGQSTNVTSGKNDIREIVLWKSGESKRR